MAERKYTHGLKLARRDSTTIISIGTMEIWDGADLSLIRDTIFGLVNRKDVSSIAIDMSCVQHVPSGFFGMLFDWNEKGIAIRLLSPRDRVMQMLWFRKFFEEQEPNVFRLCEGVEQDVLGSDEPADETLEESMAAAHLSTSFRG